ncbi:MAG: Flp pilus assembly complex ATPase component TadA, partial [Deltaproteobacteria bacterium]|nr:Flp pilus assembly complex ATPase component TadA [Deltaproteobacteria bacterium]
LQAMNTGHDGSLTTIHSNSPRDALMRLESMVAMANLGITTEFMRRFISSALNLVIHIARLVDGSRKVTSIQEITGMEGDIITMQEIFSFKQTSVDEDGKARGYYQFHGVRPRFTDRLTVAGVSIPDDIFAPDEVVRV